MKIDPELPKQLRFRIIKKKSNLNCIRKTKLLQKLQN